MKSFIILILSLSLTFALDETSQIKKVYPLQNSSETAKLLCQMQSDITTYLRKTPLSAYSFFDERSASLKSQGLITWIHGNLNLASMSAAKDPYMRLALKNEKSTHLGDYRYDMFTLLSDLLLQMQLESDFSGSKEKAILNTFIDGYFERLENDKLQCPCIDEALSEVKASDVLVNYTKVQHGKRIFKTESHNLSKVDTATAAMITQKMDAYLADVGLLKVKAVALDSLGDYLLLSEGKSDSINDDMVFKLSLNTLPVSYQINTKMKNKYFHKSLLDKAKAVSSFNQKTYAGLLTMNKQKFYVSRITPELKLRPQSEQTRAYKNYAAALGYMLASFHANTRLNTCKDFSKKATQQVKKRLLKTELISMIYAYNETLEENWEDFSMQPLLTCK